jgi:hypothetical protein
MRPASYTPIIGFLCEGKEKKRKIVASATVTEPNGKKMKVLTHRPRYIEPAVVPVLVEGASSTAETKPAALITQSVEEPTVMPNTHTVEPVEDKVDKVEEPKVEEIIKMPKILSPPTEAKLPKVQKASTATPKRRRMANMLDAVLETTKALSPAPSKKTIEAAKTQAEAETRQAEAGATQAQAEAEARPSVPNDTEPVAPEEKTTEHIAPKKIEAFAPKASNENDDYIIRHTPGKKISKEETLEARHYEQKLKYPEGALVFNGTNDDDFLYCLRDNKEISVCQEIGKSMGFPKLEDGLSILSKDDLADSLAYNSIKVQKLALNLRMTFYLSCSILSSLLL